MNYTLLIVLLMFFLTLNHSNASSPNRLFPHGCEVKGFGFDQHYLIVNDSGEQSFYLIQNRSNYPIELHRVENQNGFMSPSLATKLDSQQWGAFASDIQNFHFQCLAKETEPAQIINCREVLEICQYPRVKFALSNMGNYWVATNKQQAEVINEATKKGIYLRW